MNNSKMKFLNAQLYGLSGLLHPALQHIQDTRDCKKLRSHLKFLTCDIVPHTPVTPACSLCDSCSTVTVEHIVVSCKALSEVRNRIFPELINTVSQVQPMSGILSYNIPAPIMTQFILDCASFNLPDTIRIPVHNPRISEIYRVARDFCFAVSNERSRLLRQIRSRN